MSAASWGLCGTCLHLRVIESKKGSRFVLCERSRTDASYPRYPALPVLRCAGWVPELPQRPPGEGVR